WDKWSRQSPKYEEGEPARRWQSFNGSGGVTVATIFDFAKQNGWQRPKGLRSSSGGSGARSNGHTPAASADQRPEIVITTEEHDVNDQALAALSRDPGIYRR